MDTSLRVLVVDDEPRNLRIVKEILEDLCDFDTAPDGATALERLNSFQPDILILDVMMPGLSGLDLCRQIKANPTLAQIKVILSSGRASLAERAEGLAAGADAYITKPFTEEELRETLQKVSGVSLS